MAQKILVATEKPFAAIAVDKITAICSQGGFPCVLLESYTEKKELLTAVKDAEALIVRSDIVDAELINAAEKLQIVVRAGAGYDNIDLEAAGKRGIVVMNTPGQNANAVAELAFSMMLYLARKGFAGKSGTELRGKTIGLHAYGNVGRYVAMIAQGFGMKALAFDPFVKPEKIREDGVHALDDIKELYRQSDYISLHLPKTKETTGSINKELLSLLKPGAVLINTARAEIVDENSLLQVFAENPGFMYGSDVAPGCREEIANRFPGRFIFTAKKMGAQTEEANINAAIASANQIIAFFKTGDRTFQVNR